jgi:hypothetical protein
MNIANDSARGHPRAWMALPLVWALAAGCQGEQAGSDDPVVAAAPEESAQIEKDVVRRLEGAGLGAVPDAVANLTPVFVRALTEHAGHVESGAYDGPQGALVRGKLLETVKVEAAAVAPNVAFETLLAAFPEFR